MNNHGLKSVTKLQIKNSAGQVIKDFYLQNDSLSELKNNIKLELKDKDNKLIDKKIIPFDSFTAQFIQMLYEAMFGIGSSISNYITPTNSSFSSSVLLLGLNATASSGALGIRVGTGTAAVAIDNYLGTLITNGTSSGQLSHSAMSIGAAVLDSTVWKITVYRTFTNNSPGNITVNEVLLCVSDSKTQTNVAFVPTFARDRTWKGGSTINNVIQVGQTLTVTYTFYLDSSYGFVKGFAKLLESAFAIETRTTENVTGSLVNIVGQVKSSHGINAASGVTDYGIVVGTSSSAMNPNSYSLGSQIGHGTGSGQLLYSNVTVAESISSRANLIVSNKARYTPQRVFTNLSGAPITVREIGIIIQNDNAARRILTFRKLTGDVVINNTESLTVSQQFYVEA